ncbi:hypothetical protein [Microbacterium hominis]|nr:hypothetical protein [Microbacterium hominis]
MPDLLAAALGWVVPVLVGFVVAALALSITVWAVRRSRRSPRARAAAEQARRRAGATLVRLDDAVAAFDVELTLSGALIDESAPPTLRRSRRTAQRARDESFASYRALSAVALHPTDVRRGAHRVEHDCDAALEQVTAAAAEHRAWAAQHVSARTQLDAARARLAHLHDEMGEPTALVTDLSTRFAEQEWRDAAQAARTTVAQASESARLLDAAEAHVTRAGAEGAGRGDAHADLVSAERARRRAETALRVLEERHRLVTQAAQAVPEEVDAARTAVRQAMATREHLDPVEGTALEDEIRAIANEVDDLTATAARNPTGAIDRIARLRRRLDHALDAGRTDQQRLRAARTALPGTLAAARSLVARAEARLSTGDASADARALLSAAQIELATARQAHDPVMALDAARRAMSDADAVAAPKTPEAAPAR